MLRATSLIAALLTLLAVTAWACAAHADNLPSLDPPLRWDELPPIPDQLGFGGPFAGVYAGALVVAGGANFPDGPPWGDRPGKKVWHDRVFVLPSPDATWIDAGRLPKRLAYGVSISTANGLLLLGGEQDGAPVADVYRLQWNAATRKVEIDSPLPPLPKPASYLSGVAIGRTIYVAASHRSEGSDRLDTKSFWALDLPPAGKFDSVGETQWRKLPAWPGPPRHKSVVLSQTNADGKPSVYLFSGSNPRFGADGEPDLAKFEFYTDAYCFTPVSEDERNEGKTGRWRRIADMPVVPFEADSEVSLDTTNGRRPVAAASGIANGGRHLLIFSGATGKFLMRPVQDRPLFPRDVLAYNTESDSWSHAGQMPQAVVTTAVVRWGDDIVITSGEIRPGVRTPKMQRARIETSFGTANWSVLLAYLVAMVGIGVYCSRRTASTDDFFLAGRRIPWWAAGLSVFGTQLGAITFMAIPATAYGDDWVRIVSNFTIMVVIVVVIWFYLPFFRRLDITTAYEYLEKRFDVVVRLFGSTVFILFQLARMGIVLYLPSIALSAVTGMDVFLCIALMGVLATAYTVLGGIEAVIWTDVIQVLVLIGGAFVCIGVVIAGVGGLGEVISIAAAHDKFNMVTPGWDPTEKVLWVVALGMFFANLVPYTSDQAVVQRYLTTKTEKQAAASLWTNFWITAPTALLFFGLGTALFSFYNARPDLSVPAQVDQIVPWFVVHQLPAGVAGLVVAAIFAAAMSSLDSSMNSIATAFVTDFVRRFKSTITDRQCLRIARWATLVLGFFGTAIAMLLATVEIFYLLDFFLITLGLIGGPLAGVFILGIFTQRANARGTLVGALAAVAMLAWVQATPIDGFLYAAIGALTCVGVGYVASSVLPEAKKDLGGLTLRTPNASEEPPRVAET